MRYAIKKTDKTVKAYCLGENSAMEQALLREGAIRLRPNGLYELFSQEAASGAGELARPGDYFKVDTVEGRHYPYPNDQAFFLANHRHIAGDDYQQRSRPVAIWQADEALCPEVQFLLETGRLVLNPNDPARYFNAHLWGAPLSAARDATLVFYSIERDAAGQITDISFNFVARPQFEENYRLCGPEGEG